MDKIVNSYMEGNGSKSKSTKQTITTGLKRLEKILSKPFDKLTLKDFSNSENVLDKITDLYSLNTTIATILSIIKFLEFKNSKEKIIEEYRDILNELIQQRNASQGKQEFKEGEEKNWIDYEELKSQVEFLSNSIYLKDKKSFTEYRNFLILAFYTLMPPARIGNYLNMLKKDEENMKQKIDSLPKNHNYIVKTGDSYTLIFNQYKTSKVLGKVKYEIKNEILNKLITKYLEDHNNNDKNKYFMINASGKQMSQTGFTNAQSSITKKLFNKQITNNMFRRIFFTWFLSTNPTVEEKHQVLRVSGQNYKPSMVERYDKKVSVEDKPKEKSKDIVQSVMEKPSQIKKKIYKSNRIN
jgi:small-conductance mechanosensitive channel